MIKELEEELSLADILLYIKRGLWLIILCSFFCAFIGVMSVLIIDKEVYEATSTVIMAKEAARIFYDDQYTKSDIDLYQQVGNTYIEIANSNTVIDGAIQILNNNSEVDRIYTREELRKIVSANYMTGTLVIKLNATSSNSDNVSAIANAYRESFTAVANSLLPVSSLQVIDVAEVPKAPRTISLIRSAILWGTIGGCIAFGMIFVKLIIDKSKIQNSEQIEELLGIDVIVHLKSS